ncbi:MAG: hypothetical protein ABWZ91_09935 [Nocardioides sp.]
MPDARRLFLHVGLQKTGTSYLQAALLRSRESLADQGLDLVPPTKRECFELMVVVRDRYESRRDPVSDRNILERFTAQLEAAPGSRAIFSQESLAAAGPPQIERLLAACGDREVHVVLTVRDLARQLPSSWQEDVKAGGTTALVPYLRRLRSLEQSGRARHPWIHLDPPEVLARWAENLSPDRVHVVTVPPSGSPTTLLLERFARVLEVDPTRFEPEDRPSNSSLGMVQAEVLRRVNTELPEEVHRRYVYSDVVKRSFGTRVLGPQSGRKILVPGQFRPWCAEVAERQIADLDAAGYRVEGSLAELRSTDSAFADDFQRPTEREIAAASVSALATMLAARGRAEAARRSGRIRAGRYAAVDRSWRRLRARVKGLVGRSTGNAGH